MLKTDEDVQVRTPRHTNLRKISQLSGVISLPALDVSPLNFVNQFTNLKAFYPVLLMDIRLLGLNQKLIRIEEGSILHASV